MKKFLTAPRDRSPLAQTALFFLLGLGLTGAFWFATAPVAVARMMSPTEMIQAGLPPGVLIKTASKPQFLTAVCAAVKEHRISAPAIAQSAVATHREYAGDIVATVVRCSDGNCRLTAAIAAAAASAAPDFAVSIDDAAVAAAPDCADAIQGITSADGKEVRSDGKEVLADGKEILSDGKEILPSEDIPAEGPPNLAGSPPVYQPPFPGGAGGGGFVPGGSTMQICDNGRQRTLQVNQLNKFMATHPGAFQGNCQVTPSTSR